MIKIVIKDIYLKLMLNILNIYMICIVIYYSYQEEKKINKCSKLVCNLYDKNNYVVHIRS